MDALWSRTCSQTSRRALKAGRHRFTSSRPLSAIDRRRKRRAFVRALSGAHSELYDYLAEEVIGDLTDRQRRFLMRTALLESVDVEEAALVTDLSRSDVAELLLESERLGLLARRAGRGIELDTPTTRSCSSSWKLDFDANPRMVSWRIFIGRSLGGRRQGTGGQLASTMRPREMYLTFIRCSRLPSKPSSAPERWRSRTNTSHATRRTVRRRLSRSSDLGSLRVLATLHQPLSRVAGRLSSLQTPTCLWEIFFRRSSWSVTCQKHVT